VWCKQLFADPRASLCVEATAPVAGHVGVDGTVAVHELPDADIWPMSRRLVDKYMAAEHRDTFFAKGKARTAFCSSSNRTSSGRSTCASTAANAPTATFNVAGLRPAPRTTRTTST